MEFCSSEITVQNKPTIYYWVEKQSPYILRPFIWSVMQGFDAWTHMANTLLYSTYSTALKRQQNPKL